MVMEVWWEFVVVLPEDVVEVDGGDEGVVMFEDDDRHCD